MSRTASAPTIVWFRDDLRLADNPAMCAAVETGRPVIPVYVLETGRTSPRPLGGASKWWLHGSLEALDSSLRKLGSQLVLCEGETIPALRSIVDATGAEEVCWNRRYHPDARVLDAEIKASFEADGLRARSFNGSLLIEPWEVKTGEGSFYRVYSPFARAARQRLDPATPLPAPDGIACPAHWPVSLPLSSLDLRPTKPDWAGELRQTWTPGEASARATLRNFVDERLGLYKTKRDFAAIEATSRLSPHLRFGEISPRTVWTTLSQVADEAPSSADRQSAEKFLSEVLWREFSYHLLYHLPRLEQANVQDKFDAFPWRQADDRLAAWEQGATGYPIVDAGMRQLWRTGWMHNRVRMVVASFLTKDLLVDWRDGEAWFWDTLVDADAANNPASWQWVSGSGADAAPYFRVFNPVLQGKKFDPEGDYVRAFVPELAKLPAKHIHEPWLAPDTVLSEAGISLGTTYPERIVDHAAARKRALEAYQKIKEQAA
ncbi:cryptochrome/photolyase family protein [Amorphus sp. MBR-141]